ncbi:MAG: trypsin-like peptidase domain-containing protein [Planctomycetes bacterium]|nr:trypsin-like peptidase domain-containing protein [Planctomycetota bacterium]
MDTRKHIKTVIALIALVHSLSAQAADWELAGLQKIGEIQPYDYRCGPVRQQSGGVQLVAEHIVRFANASYLRLSFSAWQIADGGWIEVQSLADGETEYLDTAILERHCGLSAFFNGEAVRLRFYAASSPELQSFRVHEVAVGLAQAAHAPLSLCGVDDRVPSQDKRVARIVLNGAYCKCTAFLISPRNCFATAGHCFGNFTILSMAVEFGVPPSDAQGNCQHPPVAQQYKWMGSNKRIYEDAGMGDDWAVFTTEKNSVTDLHAGQAQGAYFRFVPVPALNSSLRVTGHGVDTTPDATRNRTQQTSTGPLVEVDGTVLRYRVDTMDGNSGGPVIDVQTDRVVAIHTTAGCKAQTDSNKGTWIYHPDFLDACDELCGPPDWGNFDRITAPPSGCGGSGIRRLDRVVAGHNAAASRQDLAMRQQHADGIEYLLAARVRQATRLESIEILTGAMQSSPIRVPVSLFLADATGGPSTTRVSGGELLAPPGARWCRATIEPVELPAGTKVFVGLSAPSSGMVWPVLEAGSAGTHWERSAFATRGPLRLEPWAFRLRGSEPGAAVVPAIQNAGVPTPGHDFDILADQLPARAPAILVQGYSHTSWGSLRLPLPLRSFGGGDCKIGVSHDSTFVHGADAEGRVKHRVRIPPLRGIGGVSVYYQWLVLDARANALGLSMTDVACARVGHD